MDLLDDLAFRDLTYQVTNADGLRQHLAAPRSVYAGFDPTANSLTVGHLVPLLQLVRFQRAGHVPVAVLGGGTGLIGDPSFKANERSMLTLEEVQANVDGQRPTFERLLDFSGKNAARLLNNVDWLGKLGFLEALRDIGKHFSVNMMIQKDSVRERLNSREQGISYTEFSYMLLQAYDFLHLHDAHGVSLQAAGSDQWGNIVAGVELIRRLRRTEVFGLTSPLLTKADGTKFGKTESGNVWLNADRTSPYVFYQFWLNTADTEIPRYLKTFTLLERERVEELLETHRTDPGRRAAHQVLAAYVTELVHGPSALAEAQAATAALFSGDVRALPRHLLDEVFASAPSTELAKSRLEGGGTPLPDFLVEAGVAKSKREARELLEASAVTINGRKAGLDERIDQEWLLFGEMALVRRGKKNWHVVRVR